MLSAAVLWSEAALAWNWTLPDTGQTGCYDASGNEIACGSITTQTSSYGQDANYNGSQPHFEQRAGEDGDIEIVTDLNTGLLWQYNGSYTGNWSAAQSYCDSLELGGLDDWRLPSTQELGLIVNYGGDSSNRTFSSFSMDGDSYWANESLSLSGATYYRTVYFSSGRILYAKGSSSKNYICVCGDSPSASFTPYDNNTNADSTTGLIWMF